MNDIDNDKTNIIKSRSLDFIDIAKEIGILCVVSGHLVGEGGIFLKAQ